LLALADAVAVTGVRVHPLAQVRVNQSEFGVGACPHCDGELVVGLAVLHHGCLGGTIDRYRLIRRTISRSRRLERLCAASNAKTISAVTDRQVSIVMRVVMLFLS
jgi:hypothetical protein